MLWGNRFVLDVECRGERGQDMPELLSSGNLLLEWTFLINSLELRSNMFEGMVVTRTGYYKVDL